MNRGGAERVLLAVLAAAAVALGVIWFLGGGGPGLDPTDAEAEVAQPRQRADAFDTGPAFVREVELAVAGGEERPRGDEGVYDTTVLWPLEVRLDLVRPADLPEVPNGPALGSGRTAALAGQITGTSGDPVPAVVEFVGGPNEGRVLHGDEQGRFGATDLYPGLDIVTISGPGTFGAKREVRLRQARETLLNVGFSLPGGVLGEVFDDRGEPVAGARVTVDGQPAVTDEFGRFHVPRVAPGQVLAEVDAEGFAAARQTIGISQRFLIELGRVRFVLEPAASLSIRYDADVGGPGPALAYLLPPGLATQRGFPWYRVNPVEVPPGGVEVPGLPPGVVQVYLYRAGVRSEPRLRQLNLVAGQPHEARFVLERGPLVTGVVTRDGNTVDGAVVRLTAADPVGATLAHLRQPSSYLEVETMPLVPPAEQVTRTDGTGRFVLTSWSDVSRWATLVATSPDGGARSVTAVGPDSGELQLELRPVEEGRGELVLDIGDRFQGLPIDVFVNGRPRTARTLPSGRDLSVSELAPGTWRVRVDWYDRVLVEGAELQVGAEAPGRLDVVLPEAAVLGQDRETWERAGRRFPR